MVQNIVYISFKIRQDLTKDFFYAQYPLRTGVICYSLLIKIVGDCQQLGILHY